MAKWLDWLIPGACAALIMMAQYRLVFLGEFEPFPLCGGISLLLLVRVVHQHAPKFAPRRK